MAKGKKQKQTKKGPRQRRRRAGPVVNMTDYHRLVSDPCSAPFARPPYAGGATGYMHRLQVAIPITAFVGTGTVGAASTVNFALSIQPSSFPGYLIAAANSSSTGIQFVMSSTGGTFLQNASVKSFRPIAACAKWVPTGAIAVRAGMIALGYSQGSVKTAGDSGLAADIFAFSQDSLERASNGSSAHELRFLPTPNDEAYGPVVTGSHYAGAGTMLISGVGIDAVYTATNTVTANGYIEFTMVYEWIPVGTVGLSSVPEPPAPFTSQQYQSRLGDVGHFLLTGATKVAGALGSGFVSGAVQSISSLTSTRRFARSQPLLLGRDEM